VQPGVGHYGVFNGTRWRTEIQPRIREMIRTIQLKRRMGNTSLKFALPYRNLVETREAEIPWQTETGEAQIDGASAKASTAKGKGVPPGE
jgi:poly(3-hydroxybutyrate) depolymerase